MMFQSSRVLLSRLLSLLLTISMLLSMLLSSRSWDAVDKYIPTPDRKADLPFLMPVEDVFTITGRGTVATGRVERGQLKLSEEVEIVGLTDEKRKVVVTGIEMFRKLLDYAEAGDNIGRTFSVAFSVQKSSVDRFLLSQDQSILIQSLRVRFTF